MGGAGVTGLGRIPSRYATVYVVNICALACTRTTCCVRLGARAICLLSRDCGSLSRLARDFRQRYGYIYLAEASRCPAAKDTLHPELQLNQLVMQFKYSLLAILCGIATSVVATDAPTGAVPGPDDSALLERFSSALAGPAPNVRTFTSSCTRADGTTT